MKANELMIGDWVNIYTFPNDTHEQKDLYPAIITSIIVGAPDENLNSCEGIIPKSEGGYGVFARPIDTISPIPLTAEILEKNGFRNNRDKWMQLGNFDNPPLLMWHLKDESKFGHPETQLEIHWGTQFTHISFNCTEVHQLQHALRLCGIEKEIEL